MLSLRLKEIRQLNNISQKDLADRLNTTAQAISYYEGGKRELPNGLLQQIANQFNINLHWLLTGNGTMLLTDQPKPELSAEDAALLEDARAFIIKHQPKSIKIPNINAPADRNPESVHKYKPLDYVDNNVSKGVLLTDLHKVTAKKMAGSVAAGYGGVCDDHIEEIISADQVLGHHGENVYSFTVVGESMKYVNIVHGDLVMIRATATARLGDIVLARTTDGLTLKTYAKDKSGQLVLHCENYDYPDILIDKTIKIIGVATSVVRVINAEV
jgi:DNA polymerase V